MGQAYCGISRIDALAAVPGRAHDINADVFLVNVDIHFLRLRHNCYCNRGRMDAPAGLCLRHTLYPMDSRFIFHYRICAASGNHKGYILHAADPDLLALHKLHPPSSALGIMKIHAVDLCRKKRSLIPTGSGADLNYNIFIIIGIFREEQDLKLML